MCHVSSRKQTGVAACAAVGFALNEIALSDMIDRMKGAGHVALT